VAGQQTWLRQYMDDWYFWYADSPRPSASGYVDVASYFDAILYTGNRPRFPPTAGAAVREHRVLQPLLGDGATLGYGVSVAGLEITGLPHEPLYVRYVEALSPAALQGRSSWRPGDVGQRAQHQRTGGCRRLLSAHRQCEGRFA
jgi:carboxyl-terminal processing protease